MRWGRDGSGGGGAAAKAGSGSSRRSGVQESSGGGGGGGDNRSLDEKIQLLDEIVSGVWGLGDPVAGRYARVVHAFEGWIEKAAGVLEAQRRGRDFGALVNGGDGGNGDDGDDIVLFLSDLDDSGWKGECAGLARRLDGYRQSLRELGDAVEEEEEEEEGGGGEPPDGAGGRSGSQPRRSGLAQVLEGSRSLVHGMLAELEAMEQIGRDAEAAENEWIERMSGELKVDDSGSSSNIAPSDTPSRQDVPLWKMAV